MAVLRIRSPLIGREERLFEWDGHPITLGRDAACDVVLLEQTASRRHARLERRGDEIVLDARGSDGSDGNGIWIGDERVQTHTLQDGETFRIGQTTIQLVLDPFSLPTIAETALPSDEPSAREAEANEVPVTARAPAIDPAPASIATDTRPHDAVVSASVIGVSPTPAREHSGPRIGDAAAGVSPTADDAPEASRSDAYTLGSAERSDDARALGRVSSSSASVYSMGEPVPSDPHDAAASGAYELGSPLTPEPGPHAQGLRLGSSASAYSLGDAPPETAAPVFTPHAPSAPSAYSLGDAPPVEGRGPDTPIDPPPRQAPASSAALGPAPPPPAPLAGPGSASPARPAVDPGGFHFGGHHPSAPSAYSLGEPVERATPEAMRANDHRPSAPSAYSLGDAAPANERGPDTPAPPASRISPDAPTSWGWSDANLDPRRSRTRTAGSTLWLGLGLVFGGLVAMAVALATGYDPRELLDRVGIDIGGSP